jgi:hypothetical protein
VPRCDDVSVDGRDAAEPYPIVLARPGPRWSIAFALAVTVLAVLVSAGSVCSTACRQQAVFVGVVGAVASVGLVWDRMKDGTKRRLVIDRRGFVVEGRAVPWEAVMSMAWVPGDGERREHIEVRTRTTTGFRAPRLRSIIVDHGSYGMKPNTLIDLFEAAALPRRIPVLAIEPPRTKAR